MGVGMAGGRRRGGLEREVLACLGAARGPLASQRLGSSRAPPLSASAARTHGRTDGAMVMSRGLAATELRGDAFAQPHTFANVHTSIDDFVMPRPEQVAAVADRLRLLGDP